MTREQIKEVLLLAAKNPPFIIRKEIAQALGYKNEQRVDKFIDGLDRLDKKYHIDDVATSIYLKVDRA